MKRRQRRKNMKRTLISVGLLSLSCLVTAGFPPAAAQEKPPRDARGTVEGYVRSALAGKADEAAALAVAGQAPASKERIEELQGMIGVKPLRIDNVLASAKGGQAIAVSESVKLKKANPDGSDTGAIVFTVTKMADQWRIRDIDFRSIDDAKERLKAFAMKYADAKEIPAPRALISDRHCPAEIQRPFAGAIHHPMQHGHSRPSAVWSSQRWSSHG
jgi:hypothetical protein